MNDFRNTGLLGLVLAVGCTAVDEPSDGSANSGGKADAVGVSLTIPAGGAERTELRSDSGAVLAWLEGTSPSVPLTLSLYALGPSESCDDVVGRSGQSAVDPVAEHADDPFPMVEHDSGQLSQMYCVVASNPNSVEVKTRLQLETSSGSTSGGTFGSTGGVTSGTATFGSTGDSGTFGVTSGSETSGPTGDDTATGTTG